MPLQQWSHILYRPLNDLRSRSLAVGVAYPVYASARVLEQPVSSPERAEQLPHWLRRGSPAVPCECTATAVSAERLARGSVWAVAVRRWKNAGRPQNRSLRRAGTGACLRVFRRRRRRSCSASRATTTSSSCCCYGCSPGATRAHRACSACCCALRCTSCGPALRHFLRAPRHWRCAVSPPMLCI